jgi:hypothetical protein
MTRLFLPVLSWFGAFLRSRYELGLRLAAPRQQIAVFKRQNPRPRLNWWDRLFWLALRTLWPGWASVLLMVKLESVVRWHRAAFRWYGASYSLSAAFGNAGAVVAKTGSQIKYSTCLISSPSLKRCRRPIIGYIATGVDDDRLGAVVSGSETFVLAAPSLEEHRHLSRSNGGRGRLHAPGG